MRRFTMLAVAVAMVLALPGVSAGHHPDDLPAEAQPVQDAAHQAEQAAEEAQEAAGLDHHANSNDEHSENMRLVGRFPYELGSDLAFWGDLALAGIYGSGPADDDPETEDNPGGFRVLDISRPRSPRQIGRFECHGPQSDVSIFRHLAFVSVDSTMASEECGAGFASTATVAAGNHWEGIRVVDMRDPRNPTQIKGVYTDCGSHTHTIVPDLKHRDDEGRKAARLLVYALSYPLGGQGVDCNAVSHRKISVVEVPLRNPQDAQVISTPSVSPAIGCHDVTVFPSEGIAAAACITESQTWDISDPANPRVISHIYNPLINIHHSTTFSYDAGTLVIGDELGGAAVSPGCMTDGHAPLGALWFYDVSNPAAPSERGYFVIPQNEEPLDRCTAHNFNVLPFATEDPENPPPDILVSAWYHGGTTVVDFTDPSNPTQVAYYEPEEMERTRNGETQSFDEAEYWSSYWYNGFIYGNNFQSNRGFEVMALREPFVKAAVDLPFLNPQTQIPPGTRLPR